MKKFFGSLSFLFLGFLMAVPVLGGTLRTKHKIHRRHSLANLEMWCGAPTKLERERFPFLAAIHNYRTPTGKVTQTATIYKKGRAIMREYVTQTRQGRSLSYKGAGDFSLTFGSEKMSWVSHGDLKAYVRDEDGNKFIENGTISCFRTHKT